MSALTDEVKNLITSAVSGAGDILSTAQNVAKENVVKAVQGVGTVAVDGIQAIDEVVSSGVEALAGTGSALTNGVTGLIKGVVGAAKEVGVGTAESAGEAASVAIKTASRVGGEEEE